MKGGVGVGGRCELVTFPLGVEVHVLRPLLCPGRCVRGKGHASRLLTHVCTHRECSKFHKLETPRPARSKEVVCRAGGDCLTGVCTQGREEFGP